MMDEKVIDFLRTKYQYDMKSVSLIDTELKNPSFNSIDSVDKYVGDFYQTKKSYLEHCQKFKRRRIMENTKIFFNIDTQQDFFDRESVDIPNSESVLDNLKSVNDYLKTNQMKTIHTIRWFNEDSDFFSEMLDYVSKFPKHCVKDSKGKQIHESNTPGYFLINWEGGNLVFPKYIETQTSW